MRALKIVGLASAAAPAVVLRLQVCQQADRLTMNLNGDVVQVGKEYNNRPHTHTPRVTDALTSTGNAGIGVARELSATMNVKEGCSAAAAVDQRHESTCVVEPDQRTSAERNARLNWRAPGRPLMRIETDYLKARRKGTLDFSSKAVDDRRMAAVYRLPFSVQQSGGHSRAAEQGRRKHAQEVLHSAERGPTHRRSPPFPIRGASTWRPQGSSRDRPTVAQDPPKSSHEIGRPSHAATSIQEVIVRCSRHAVRVWRHKLGEKLNGLPVATVSAHSHGALRIRQPPRPWVLKSTT